MYRDVGRSFEVLFLKSMVNREIENQRQMIGNNKNDGIPNKIIHEKAKREERNENHEKLKNISSK